MKYWLLGLGTFVLIFILVLVGRNQDDAGPAPDTPHQVFPAPVAVAGVSENNPRPRVTEVTVDSPGAVRLVNRVRLAEVAGITMLQYYEKDTGDQWLYFFDGTFATHVFLPEFDGIQSDRFDFRGTRFDQAEHVLPALDGIWIFSEAPADNIEPLLGYMSPVLISHYALTGGPLPTEAVLRSSRTFGDEHSRTGAFTALQSGGMIASWYQSYVVNPYDDRRLEIGIAYRNPRGKWSTMFPIAVDGSAGGGIMQSRQALVQHPADGSIWLFNKRDSFHSLEAVHLSETASGFEVDWIDPRFINSSDHGDNGVEGEFPGIMAIADPVRDVIVLAYGDNRFEMTNCGGNCFNKVTHVTVATIAADGTRSFVTHTPFTIERTTRFGMALKGDSLWFVYKPRALAWPPSAAPPSPLEVIIYNLKTDSWSQPLALGEPFKASREIAPVFSTPPLDFAYLMADEKIHYFMIENE